MTRRMLVGIGVLGTLVSISGCKSPDSARGIAEVYTIATNAPRQSEQANASHDGPVLSVHLQAEVYEVKTADSGLSMGSKDLAKQAGSPELLLRKLGTFGKAHLLYRFDQMVNAFSETLSIGSSEPMIMGSRRDVRGEQINSVRYQNVGANLKLAGRNPPGQAKRKALDVTVSLHLAAMAESDVEITPGQKAPSVRSVSMEHTGQLEAGRPIVLVTSSSASGPATVYVLRYVFGK